jgi:hypothetical protein
MGGAAGSSWLVVGLSLNQRLSPVTSFGLVGGWATLLILRMRAVRLASGSLRPPRVTRLRAYGYQDDRVASQGILPPCGRQNDTRGF